MSTFHASSPCLFCIQTHLQVKNSLYTETKCNLLCNSRLLQLIFSHKPVVLSNTDSCQWLINPALILNSLPHLIWFLRSLHYLNWQHHFQCSSAWRLLHVSRGKCSWNEDILLPNWSPLKYRCSLGARPIRLTKSKSLKSGWTALVIQSQEQQKVKSARATQMHSSRGE